jgi:hypothetical protein
MIPNLTFMCTCPCCGKPAQIHLIETDGEITSVGLFHISPEATPEQIEASGYEFGILSEEVGEVVKNGKDQTLQR